MVQFVVTKAADASEKIVTGTPEEVAQHPTSYTGIYVKKALNHYKD